MSKNVGPGGCVPWDDFAIWIRRVDIHLRAANEAANQLDSPAPMIRPLWATLDTLREEIDAAMVVNGVKRAEAVAIANLPTQPKDAA